MSDTYEISPTLRVSLSPDEGTEDPRSWDPSADVLQYHVPYLDGADHLGDCSTSLGVVFTIVWGNTGDEVKALKVAERYKRVFDVKEDIAISYITGYSQGDWAHVLAVVPEGNGTAESHIKVFADWKFNRVYTVTLERRVAWARLSQDLSRVLQGEGSVRETWEEIGSVGGVYFDDEFPERNEILTYVKENAWEEIYDDEQDEIDNLTLEGTPA